MGRARSGMLRRSARVGYEEPAVVGLLLFSGGRLFFWCSKVFSLPGGRDGLGVAPADDHPTRSRPRSPLLWPTVGVGLLPRTV